VKFEKIFDRNTGKTRYSCEFTEKEADELWDIYHLACSTYEGCYGVNKESDIEIRMLRKWGKRFGWRCIC